MGGGSTDFIQLSIYDLAGNLVFLTPDYWASGAVIGSDSSTLIPAGTLGPNQAYTAFLAFMKMGVPDRTSYPGALGWSGFSSATQFRLVTRGSGNPPHLSLLPIQTNQVVVVSAHVVPGLSYRLEGSSNLTRWIPLSTNAATTDSLQWIESTRPPLSFYRALVLP